MANESPYYVAVVPINMFEQVLIGKRKEDGIWTTPAGGANEGESPENCAVRECFEEAGLLVDKSRLELVGVKNAPNGKPVHCFLYRTSQLSTHTAHDPDREVDEWVWTSASQLPKELSRKKNQNRLETINEAYMKFHGLTKSKWLDVGMKVEMEHTKDKKKAREIAQDHLNEDPDYYKDWDNKEKILFQEKAPKIKKSIESLIDKLEKGGPGSGKRGHTTTKPSNVVSLTDKLKQKPGQKEEPPRNKLQDHFDKLKSGSVIENAKTNSGKPVVLDNEAARAHGYTVEDHNDAFNVHHQLHEKWSKAVEKYKAVGHKIPEEAHKIVAFHKKKMQDHYKESNRLHQRQQEVKDAQSSGVKKSTTQMGHHEAGDINTADYAMALETSQNSKWLDSLYKLMDDYEYGDEPRELHVDKGVISLVKVDDGQYTGYFRRVEDVEGGSLEDNAKIRIERITIPDLVQLMMAKEWINPQEEESESHIEEIIEDEKYSSLDDKLSEPQMAMSPERLLDKKIRMLELMNKLLN